jgi:hypothetical protein
VLLFAHKRRTALKARNGGLPPYELYLGTSTGLTTTSLRRVEAWRYSFKHTCVLGDRGEWWPHAPAGLPLGKKLSVSTG